MPKYVKAFKNRVQRISHNLADSQAVVVFYYEFDYSYSKSNMKSFLHKSIAFISHSILLFL